MANTIKNRKRKFDAEVLTDYNINDWRKNVYFLKHLIACIEGKHEQYVVDNTIMQMKQMIKKIIDDIQEKNSSLGSKD